MQKNPTEKLRSLHSERLHWTMLAWALQVMCQRSALSPDAVADEPLSPRRDGPASRKNPVGNFRWRRGCGGNAVVRYVGSSHVWCKKYKLAMATSTLHNAQRAPAGPRCQSSCRCTTSRKAFGPLYDGDRAGGRSARTAVRNGVRRRRQQGRHSRGRRRARAPRSAAAHRQVPPQLRPDGRDGRGHRACERRSAGHHGRRPAERSGRYRAAAGADRRRLRPGRRLAPQPPGQADLAQDSLRASPTG